MASSTTTRLSGFDSKQPFVTFYHLYDGQWRNLTFAAVFFFIKQTPLFIFPIATARVVDAVSHITPETPRILWTTGLVYGFLLLQNIPTHTLYVRYSSRAIRSVQLLLRSALVERMQQLSISYHNRVRSGTLHAKVMRDSDNIESISRQLFNNVLGGILIFVFAITVTLINRPVIALYFLVSVPISIAIVRGFRKQVRRRHNELRLAVEDMSGRVAEMVRMIPTTRAHGLEEWEMQDVQKNLQNIRTIGERLDTTSELFSSSSWAAFQTLLFACLLFCCWLIYRGDITVGEAIMYQGFFGMLVGSINQLMSFMPVLTSGAESIRSIGEVLEAPDIEQNEQGEGVTAVAGGYTFANVTYSYPGKDVPAIKDMSLDVKAGECIAFVGESGSGKSTLINLIIGFLRPAKGQLLVDGRDLQRLNLRQYRQFLAVVPQSPVLFSGTVRENIAYGLDNVAESDIRAAVDAANLNDVLQGMPKGLDTEIGENGVQLSGGQRQRMAIARAIIRDPQVIILDEATSALDVMSEKLVQEALDRLVHGRTTFVVAHRLTTVRKATRIVVLQQGSIVEIGNHDELTALQGHYHRLNTLHG